MENRDDAATSRKRYPQYLEWLRYISAYIILTYGTRKLIGGGQFAMGHTLGNRPIESLSGFELTWFYYAYSHTYSNILGLTQIVAGVLLLSRKTALLGAAVLTPIMVNILLINIFFDIALGAEIVSAFVLGSMLLMLWQQREALLDAFWRNQHAEPVMGSGSRRQKIAAVILVVLVVLAEVVLFEKLAPR
jgi:hypothetical protein